MTKHVFMNDDKVSQYLNISKPFAYKIIKQLNKELEARGYIVIAGKINKKFFEERMYGTNETGEVKETS
ncbi:hypothetical protein M2475_000850 [Breznakia sp. PF5-3]|uniref:LysR family transcriptional regulator n=1 Tax=unclassified Breznakia TaxID=2623764 RepID=UPI002406B6F8|nr:MULTISPECIES: LysR family transcriptional regulator [unclassified Breznakia]MDF9824499.1 hypothetical protein [Breznakia sp. PM6-1]MDF9835285.1 hypothetical protein [Breznakia sp. PF5-3]MDF9837001.1 hypothetical protein [Breznakia sp. PFB2-8]MDF9858926.1 hypothetical protein [Breznakia sp. PH5-24]